MKRLHIWISGKVQGVFFRASARRKAMDLGVKGWIRNLDDGRVEAVFEGDDSSVKEMVDYCRRGPYGANVDNVEVKIEGYSNEFDSFEIF